MNKNTQPLDAINLPDALLKITTVVQIVGLSTANIYRRIAAGTFPAPIKLTARCSRWKSEDIRAWIQSQGV